MVKRVPFDAVRSYEFFAETGAREAARGLSLFPETTCYSSGQRESRLKKSIPCQGQGRGDPRHLLLIDSVFRWWEGEGRSVVRLHCSRLELVSLSIFHVRTRELEISNKIPIFFFLLCFVSF